MHNFKMIFLCFKQMAARCDGHEPPSPSARRQLFDGLPQNQAKVMTGFTDGNDPSLVGSFNWTFSLGEDLAVPEHEVRTRPPFFRSRLTRFYASVALVFG